jgi:hypothetical protein
MMIPDLGSKEEALLEVVKFQPFIKGKIGDRKQVASVIKNSNKG